MNDRSLSRHAITFFALKAILTQIDEHYRLVKVCGESQMEGCGWGREKTA
jgi:hypothetical protein